MPKRTSRKQSIKNIHPGPPIPAISKCPIEILDAIFSMACTDGGATGRSLSTVSKRIREVSKVFKYQSLLVKQHQLRSLTLILHSLPLDARRVVHLVVQSSFWGQGYGLSEDRFFDTDKMRVLAVVAHSLRTLEVRANRAQVLLPIALPSLRTLTLHGVARAKNHSQRNTACYPALKRFHFAPHSARVYNIFSLITRAAPTLEVLKLSHCKWYHEFDALVRCLHQNPTLKIILCPSICLPNFRKVLVQCYKQVTIEEHPVSLSQFEWHQ